MTNTTRETTALPFLKWAGGKRWLTSKAPELFPASFNRYIEPFLGSGAVYFYLQPSSAILSDVNLELINTYKAIKTDWRKVVSHLREHQKNHTEEYYYELRERQTQSIFTSAARMIYLNRTCWNGLYRVNLDGKFNVPIGTKTNVILDSDDFSTTASLLKKTSLLCQDFEKTVNLAKDGDFVFVDPPYTIKHNMNGFVKYNEKLFSWADQVRLKEAIDAATKRGAKVLVLNADHDSIRELYASYPNQRSLLRSSVLAGKSEFRGKYEELAIQCWHQ